MCKKTFRQNYNYKVNISCRPSEKSDQNEDVLRPGVVDLKKFGNSIIRRHADLVVKTEQKTDNTSTQAKTLKKTKREYQSPLVRII